MKESDQIKELVKEKYGQIANQSRTENATSCCGAGECGTVDYEIFSEDYTKMKGYSEDADLGLGCGIPTAFANIKEGDKVLDLGSGAGNDCFVARALVGESGKVVGVDFTETMINKARINADKLNFNNVEFRQGDIEELPLAGNTIDVVISNCVLNLVPDKKKAMTEMYRVINAGGHFSVSDVVLKGHLPAGLKEDAEMYAGCVAGAIQKDEYIQILNDVGFKNVKIQKEKQVTLPDETLKHYLNEDELSAYHKDEFGIYSITVYGEKEEACCEPGCC